MSKLLSEGLFDSIVGLLLKGKINKGVEQLKKDPELKKVMDNYEKSSRELKSGLDKYEAKYGNDAYAKRMKKWQASR